MSDKYLTIEDGKGNVSIALHEDWTIENAPALEKLLNKLSLSDAKKISVNGKNLSTIDTSGAWMLADFLRELDAEVSLKSFKAEHIKILEIIEHIEHPDSIECTYCDPFSGFFKYVGRSFFAILSEMRDLVSFFGQLCTTFLGTLLRPGRLRLKSLVYHVNEIGIKAIPIVALMAFLISIVMGYQGATQLEKFGATIFTVDLVAISVLREMGVLITAIMVAGRSGSAFAAQIGVMQVNEEVDAMRTIGLDPFEILVLPRILAIVIALPLLTFIADIVGLLGTLFVSSTLLDISLLQFLERVKNTSALSAFFIGLMKAPVFAVLIGMVGCMQGMQVRGSAAQVGQHTTRAVVQAIFLVILADAAFSVLFTAVGI